MAKIKGIITHCEDCDFCKTYQQIGSKGCDYAALCCHDSLEKPFVIEYNYSSDPKLLEIEIPPICPLEDYNFKTQ